jgi:lipoprotein-anchoring transpeptidase ErfK/SrfK
VLRIASRDQVLSLSAQVSGEAVVPHNAIWYRTGNGFVHSAWVQPVENWINLVEPGEAANKFWGEITVPFSDSRVVPDPEAKVFFRLYYTSVFRVVAATLGKDWQWWYRLQDGITWGPGPYVPAAHVRRIAPSDLTPISPDVMDKRIEVNLETQTIVAYEYNNPVMFSRVASGFGDFRTPGGKHTVLCKTPTSRMTGGQGNDYYDLPGVPFPTYFTARRAGIHGTYWHNDYGHPRSHGCVNVPSPAARWFWRWTMPVAPYDAACYETPGKMKGTDIIVS